MMGSPIRLGSICSGMITEKWACKRLPWTFEKAFWCEKDKFARKFIQDNVELGVPDFHDCQTEEFLTNAPPCDMLLTGFPCQPFSVMGRGDGLEDKQNRDSVVCWILRYVKIQKPVIVVMENVAGLVSRHRQVLNSVVASLESIGYLVSWNVLDTFTHGAIPAKRKRVYIVGIRRPATGGGPATGGATMVWPQPVPCPHLDTIFDDTPKVVDYCNYPMPALYYNRKRKLIAALRQVKEAARRQCADPAKYAVVADLAGSKAVVGWDVAPCLTKAGKMRDRLFSIQHNRCLSIPEMCRLQGLNYDLMKIDIALPQMGSMLGNGFTCTVLARVMAAAIQAAEGLPPPQPQGGVGPPVKRKGPPQPQAGVGSPVKRTRWSSPLTGV